MLRFTTKPDTVFMEIINNALDLAIDALKFQDLEFDVYWLDEQTFRMFGSDASILLNELTRLQAAHNSKELFMPTDYHFRLLDRIIDWYCDIYNDEDNEALKVFLRDKVVNRIDINTIRNTFFWDNDYELFDILQSKSNSELAASVLDYIGVTPSGQNIQKEKPADLADMMLVKCEPEKDWEMVDDDFWQVESY